MSPQLPAVFISSEGPVFPIVHEAALINHFFSKCIFIAPRVHCVLASLNRFYVVVVQGAESYLTLLTDKTKTNTELRGGWREIQFRGTRDIACLYLSGFYMFGLGDCAAGMCFL